MRRHKVSTESTLCGRKIRVDILHVLVDNITINIGISVIFIGINV